MKLLLTLGMVMVLFLSSCNKHRQIPRSEWLNLTSRSYEGVSKDQAFETLEKLFTLLDGDDFEFMHTETSIIAKRKWFVYAIIAAASGTDTWQVRVDEVGADVKISLAISRNANSSSATFTPGVVNSSSFNDGQMSDPLVYSLFWTRMDYLFGKSDMWVHKVELREYKKKHDLWGDYTYMFGATLKNDLPEDYEYRTTPERKAYLKKLTIEMREERRGRKGRR